MQTISFWTPFLLQKGSKPPKMRLTIRIPPSAEGVKGLCPFETHHLLKKVDENFFIFFPQKSRNETKE